MKTSVEVLSWDLAQASLRPKISALASEALKGLPLYAGTQQLLPSFELRAFKAPRASGPQVIPTSMWVQSHEDIRAHGMGRLSR